jgi:rhamnulokinase
MANANFIAVDLGASSGRVLWGKWDGQTFDIEVLHRFPNGPVNVLGRLYWDVLRLWEEIKTGLVKYRQTTTEPLISIGLDTWGVDYALLDEHGILLSNPYHYRDSACIGMVEEACNIVPKEEIYGVTGLQFMHINSLTQLLARIRRNDPQLSQARTLLMMPDLLHYWLSGQKVSEYTAASTSQLLNAKTRQWDKAFIQRFNIPIGILPAIVSPGTVIGNLREEVAQETGLESTVKIVLPASHDTGSAVASIPGLDEKSVYISSGTWSLIGIERKEPIMTKEALDLNYTNEGGVNGSIRVLKNVAGMWLLEESRRQWRREGQEYSWEDLLYQATEAKPFLCFLDPDDPAFAQPGDLPSAVRAFCEASGQRSPQTPGELVRCYLESLALKSWYTIQGLERICGHGFDRVCVVGGGSQNHLMNQFTSDACNKPVVAGPVEATALGNLIIQAIATGHIENLEAGRRVVAASVEQTFYEPKNNQSWQDAYKTFKQVLKL